MIDNAAISRRDTRVTFSARLALLGLFVAFAAGTAQANEGRDANATCRQETKRVAVWPKGPKAQKKARFEDREVTICDGKVTARSPESATNAKAK